MPPIPFPFVVEGWGTSPPGPKPRAQRAGPLFGFGGPWEPWGRLGGALGGALGRPARPIWAFWVLGFGVWGAQGALVLVLGVSSNNFPRVTE